MAASLDESRRRGGGDRLEKQQQRVTLRNYLDMSRSLNLEPGGSLAASKQNSSSSGRPPLSRTQQRFDMTKSLNVDSGFFKPAAGATGSRIESAAAHLVLEGFPCEQDELRLAAASHRSSRRNSMSLPASERVSNASAADASSLFQAGFRNKVLPASPNLVDSLQEQQLIDAFVDQLKNIATSSCSIEQTRRRAVRRALEFPPEKFIVPPRQRVDDDTFPEEELEIYATSAAPAAAPKQRMEVTVVAASPTQKLEPLVKKKLQVAVVAPAPTQVLEVCATVAQACKSAAASAAATGNGGVAVVDTARMKAKLRNAERQPQQRHPLPNSSRRALPRVEEKQTVISSPISHNALTTPAFRTRLKSADMPPAIQHHAVERALQLVKGMDKLNARLVASQLKKEFDKIHGPAWHCIVGTSFGSYVTHSVGGFIYFAVGKVSILLFRTAIQVVQAK